MTVQRKLSTLALALAAMAATGLAQASEEPFFGGSSNEAYIKVGKSDVDVYPIHTPGRAGISVYTSGIDLQVDFQGLSTASTLIGSVYTLSSPILDPYHPSGMGVFAFSRAGSGDVWFGEWSGNGDITDGTHTAYYVGDTTGTSLPSGGKVKYAVTGINGSGAGSVLSGTFTANFNTNRLSGKLTRTGSSTINKLTLGKNSSQNYVTIDPLTATFSGKARADTTSQKGTVEGRFYGANAAALAGMATFADSSKDVAFGGGKKP